MYLGYTNFQRALLAMPELAEYIAFLSGLDHIYADRVTLFSSTRFSLK